MNLLNYTNGVGHLIMSIFMTLVGLALILYPGIPAATQGIGIGIIMAVQAAWFVPGAAKQVATEVVKQLPTLQQASNAGAAAGAVAAAALASPIDGNTPTQKLPAVKA